MTTRLISTATAVMAITLLIAGNGKRRMKEGETMYRKSTHRIPRVLRAGLALTAALLMSAQAAQAETAHGTDDTFIELDKPWKNNGAEGGLMISDHRILMNGVFKDEAHIFVRFDLSTLFPNVEIEKATLRLFVNKVVMPGSFDLHLVNAAWSEGTLMAGTAPATTSTGKTVAITNADEFNFVIVDVTDKVQGWVDDPGTNFGFAFLPTANGGIDVALDAKENTLTGHSMEIEIIPFAVAPGGVLAYNLPACPPGWSPLPDAEGRYIVGGDIGVLVGSALSPGEDRPVGRHNHAGTTETAGSHNHSYSDRARRMLGAHGLGLIATVEALGSTTDVSRTTASAGNHSHDFVTANTGSVPGTPAPYIQLLICQKD